MVRDLAKILDFKRLTQVGKTRQLQLGNRVRKRILQINSQITDKRLPSFTRPYLYVALATCLEADVKYKARGVMELVGNDLEVFKKLYGEGRLDLDFLFHIVNENITSSDLVAENTSVSDLASLISKCETILNLISGQKNNIRFHFEKFAAMEKPDLTDIVSSY